MEALRDAFDYVVSCVLRVLCVSYSNFTVLSFPFL